MINECGSLDRTDCDFDLTTRHESTFLSCCMLACFWEVTLEFVDVFQNKQTCLYTNRSAPRTWNWPLSVFTDVCWPLYSVGLTGFSCQQEGKHSSALTKWPPTKTLYLSTWHEWMNETDRWSVIHVYLPGSVSVAASSAYVDVPACWIQVSSLSSSLISSHAFDSGATRAARVDPGPTNAGSEDVI